MSLHSPLYELAPSLYTARSWSEASKCWVSHPNHECSRDAVSSLEWPSTFSRSIGLNAASIKRRKIPRRQNICDEREHQKKDFCTVKKQWSVKESEGQVKKQRAVNMKLKVSHNNLWGRKETSVSKILANRFPQG